MNIQSIKQTNNVCPIFLNGKYSDLFKVSFNQLDKVSRARARELNIQLCCHVELRNLQHHLQTWLTTER